jgi:hypothetical protein
MGSAIAMLVIDLQVGVPGHPRRSRHARCRDILKPAANGVLV